MGTIGAIVAIVAGLILLIGYPIWHNRGRRR
jgi:hypothetical protein